MLNRLCQAFLELLSKSLQKICKEFKNTNQHFKEHLAVQAALGS